MSEFKREMRLAFSVLLLVIVSTVAGCVSDVRPQLKTALNIASGQHKLFCASAVPGSQDAERCENLGAAVFAASVAVDVGNEDSALSSVAEVLEGLKGTWRVKCGNTPLTSFCSASKSVVNALISVYTSVNEGAQ